MHHARNLSLLPLICKAEVVGNKTKLMDVVCSRWIQTKQNFKHIQSHPIVQSNMKVTVITTHQLLFSELDDTSRTQMNEGPCSNFKGLYFDDDSIK